ncbi:MAG: CNNM domain-containing protein [Wolinella sp.]
MSLLILYLVLCVTLSFVCSILEAAILSIPQSFVETYARQNSSSGRILKYLKENIDTSVGAILVLNTFANTMGAAGVGAEAERLFGSQWQAAFAVGLTLVILYCSEILPKTIGAVYWHKLVVPAVYTIYFFTKITAPFLVLSRGITGIFRHGQTSHTTSREEIIAMAEMGEKSGTLHSQESDLIENLLQLKNYRARDILTPRSVVFALDADALIKDVIELDGLYLHSRIPVYEGSLDNVIGMVMSQTILEEGIEGHREMSVREVMKPMFSISENLPVLRLIDIFVKRKEHLFLVHDGYGQTAGVVSLEDAIETLLGVEILDELDEVADMQQFAKERARNQKNHHAKAQKEDEAADVRSENLKSEDEKN